MRPSSRDARPTRTYLVNATLSDADPASRLKREPARSSLFRHSGIKPRRTGWQDIRAQLSTASRAGTLPAGMRSFRFSLRAYLIGMTIPGPTTSWPFGPQCGTPASSPRAATSPSLHPQGLRYLEPSSNQTLREYLIPCGKKEGIRKELARMNINEFTIYGGLDRLGNWLRQVVYRKAAWET